MGKEDLKAAREMHDQVENGRVHNVPEARRGGDRNDGLRQERPTI